MTVYVNLTLMFTSTDPITNNVWITKNIKSTSIYNKTGKNKA